MQDLFQLLQFFAIYGLVVPVLQDWRTLALACVSPWRVGGGALQASGLQLHPSTLAIYLPTSCMNLFNASLYCTILFYIPTLTM